MVGGASGRPGAGALLAQPGRQPQRHRADPGLGIGVQVRGVDALGGQERGEVAAEVAQEARQRAPRQQPGAQPGREVPLDRLAQPRRADPGEVEPLAFQGLVLADRDPPVVPRVPHRCSATMAGPPGRPASAPRAAGRWWPGGCAGSWAAAAGGAGRGSGGGPPPPTPPRSGAVNEHRPARPPRPRRRAPTRPAPRSSPAPRPPPACAASTPTSWRIGSGRAARSSRAGGRAG